jgi:hypothetical protein
MVVVVSGFSEFTSLRVSRSKFKVPVLEVKCIGLRAKRKVKSKKRGLKV